MSYSNFPPPPACNQFSVVLSLYSVSGDLSPLRSPLKLCDSPQKPPNPHHPPPPQAINSDWSLRFTSSKLSYHISLCFGNRESLTDFNSIRLTG